MTATNTLTAPKPIALPRPADDPAYLGASARADQLYAAKRKVEQELAGLDADIRSQRGQLTAAKARATAVERAADAILAGDDAQAILTNMRGLEARRAEVAADLDAHKLACEKHQRTVTTPALDAAARALAPAVVRDTVGPATLAVEAALLELSRAYRHLGRVRDAVDAAGLEHHVRVDLPFRWEDQDALDPSSAAARYLADLKADGVLPERKAAAAKAGK